MGPLEEQAIPADDNEIYPDEGPADIGRADVDLIMEEQEITSK